MSKAMAASSMSSDWDSDVRSELIDPKEEKPAVTRLRSDTLTSTEESDKE